MVVDAKELVGEETADGGAIDAVGAVVGGEGRDANDRLPRKDDSASECLCAGASSRARNAAVLGRANQGKTRH